MILALFYIFLLAIGAAIVTGTINGIRETFGKKEEVDITYMIEPEKPAYDEAEYTYLQMRRDRLTQLGSDLEREYERTTDHKKRQRLMKQILTTDQQAYTTQKKIDKLTGY